MECLLDTNILAALIQSASSDVSIRAQAAIAASAIRNLRAQGYDLWVSPQILIELYSTMTRAIRLDRSGRTARNSGLGFSDTQTIGVIAKLKTMFNLLADDAAIFPMWEFLIGATGILGNQCHDVRIAATMSAYGIGSILTFNTADFAGIPGISTLDPNTI
jgi:predicted nucleic acid-binding protein